jgi:hypothetical protein
MIITPYKKNYCANFEGFIKLWAMVEKLEALQTIIFDKILDIMANGVV